MHSDVYTKSTIRRRRAGPTPFFAKWQSGPVHMITLYQKSKLGAEVRVGRDETDARGGAGWVVLCRARLPPGYTHTYGTARYGWARPAIFRTPRHVPLSSGDDSMPAINPAAEFIWRTGIRIRSSSMRSMSCSRAARRSSVGSSFICKPRHVSIRQTIRDKCEHTLSVHVATTCAKFA